MRPRTFAAATRCDSNTTRRRPSRRSVAWLLLACGLSLPGASLAAPDVAPGVPVPTFVTNGAEDPVPVTVQGSVNVASPQRTPFQRKVNGVIGAGVANSVGQCFGVPSERWLIIQHVAASMNSETPADAVFLTIETEASPGGPAGVGYSHIFAMPAVTALPASPALRRYAFAGNTTIYASPGSSVCLSCNRAAILGEEFCLVVLDGILTDSP